MHLNETLHLRLLHEHLMGSIEGIRDYRRPRCSRLAPFHSRFSMKFLVSCWVHIMLRSPLPWASSADVILEKYQEADT